MVRAQYGRHKEKSIPGGTGTGIPQLDPEHPGLLGLHPGQLEGGQELHSERGPALGRAERAQPLRADRLQHQRQLGSPSTTRSTPRPHPRRSARSWPSSSTPASASATTGSPGELRLGAPVGQLRRHLPELDRPARPQHQLGPRLRRLPGERLRPPLGRAPEPAEVRRQLPVLERVPNRLNVGLSTPSSATRRRARPTRTS